MPHFEDLPAPIPLLILKKLPDFITLYALIRTSPLANVIVEANGTEIIASILETQGLSTSLSKTPTVLAEVRSRSVPPSCTTIQDFALTYFHHGPSPGRHGTSSSTAGIPLAGLSQGLRVTRTIIRDAANIERLTDAVLAELLARTAALQPSQPDKDGFDLASGLYSPTDTTTWPPPRAVLPSAAYAAAQRAASWLETIRVRRALWRIQLLVDIRAYAPWIAGLVDLGGSVAPPGEDNGDGTLSEPRDELLRVNQLHNLVGWGSQNLENLTVARCIVDIAPGIDRTWLVLGGGITTFVGAGRAGGEGTAAHRNPSFLYLPRMPRLYEGTEQLHGQHQTHSGNLPRRDLSQEDHAVLGASVGVRSWQALVSSRFLRPSLHQLADLVQRGVFIWDLDRLCGLGLANGNNYRETRGEMKGSAQVPGSAQGGGLTWDENTYVWMSITRDGAHLGKGYDGVRGV